MSLRDKNVLNIVLLLPPAPAALVLVGRMFATLSARSAAALRRMAVAGPPGGLGEVWRAEDEPVLGEAALTGEDGRGDDCWGVLVVGLKERSLAVVAVEEGVLLSLDRRHRRASCCCW